MLSIVFKVVVVIIGQGLTSYSGSLQAITCRAHYFYIVFSYFCFNVAELSGCDRDCIAHKDENIIWSLVEKVSLLLP